MSASAERKRDVARAVLQGAQFVREEVDGKNRSIEPNAILIDAETLANCGDYLLSPSLRYSMPVEVGGERGLTFDSPSGSLTPCSIRYLTPEAARAAFITLKIFRGDG